MHDIKAIRDAPDAYDRAWAAKDFAPQTGGLLEIDARLRAAQGAGQAAQSRRNEASKLIGQAKARKDEAEAQRLMAEVEAAKAAIAEQGEAEREAGEALRGALAALPNLPAEGVPPGVDETDNVETRRWGEPAVGSAARDHVELGETLGLMDFEAAARMSGARFVALKGGLARLERALGQFMLDLQTREHGYLGGLAAAAGARRGGVRHRAAAEVRRGPVPHLGRPPADPHRRGFADQSGARADPRRGRAAAAAHRADALLRLRLALRARTPAA